MNTREINNVTIVLLLVFLIFTAGCSKDGAEMATTVVTCTVTQDKLSNGIITCQDGTVITVPPNVINNEITIEVPVYVEVPKGNCGRGKGPERDDD
jgi:hypothetical protein